MRVESLEKKNYTVHAIELDDYGSGPDFPGRHIDVAASSEEEAIELAREECARHGYGICPTQFTCGSIVRVVDPE